MKLFVSPGLSVSEDGVTTTLMPLIDDDAVYVAFLSSTFVIRRVTVSVPASLLIAIDGTFMSLMSNE